MNFFSIQNSFLSERLQVTLLAAHDVRYGTCATSTAACAIRRPILLGRLSCCALLVVLLAKGRTEFEQILQCSVPKRRTQAQQQCRKQNAYDLYPLYGRPPKPGKILRSGDQAVTIQQLPKLYIGRRRSWRWSRTRSRSWTGMSPL